MNNRAAAVVIVAALGSPLAWGQTKLPDPAPKVDPPRLPGTTPDGLIKPEDVKASLTTGSARTLVDGCQFTEGPLWMGDGTLIFSDIPANKVYRLTFDATAKDAPAKKPADLAIFREPSGKANGNALDAQGRVIAAESDGRVTRTHEGKTETVVDKFEGKRLNSPNDVVVHSSGVIFFTDPPFFIKKADRELDFVGVFALATDGKLTPIFKSFERCNGVCLSPDQTRLYVNDSATGEIQVFDVSADGTASKGRLFAVAKDDGNGRGTADGMKCDVEGNVYTTGPGGIWAFSPDGRKIEVIRVDGRATNLCFGGADKKTMFITTGKGVVAVPMKHAGAHVK